ncbi:MAG: isoprenoid synthase domain-containing protein [Piptocephalis tieghemiana]|nr:MAG: isoprenoid synthase domain-containing protein [Piptocephalis tieghemiana]
MGYDKAAFLEVFEQLKAEVLSELPLLNMPIEAQKWIGDLMSYNVTGGKLNRGLSVVDSLQVILARDLTPKEINDACILGWCVEFLQAFFLVSDDMMDGSITRRGQPCWYKKPEVGLLAINDSFILEGSIYRILRRHFRSSPIYPDLLELFHETTWQTELGQLVDLITAPENHVDLSRFSIAKHKWIVTFKTAYYSFYLPVALAMRLSGETRDLAYSQAKDMLLPLGEFFQVQDDYLDCYGDPTTIGKIGTDIQDNKCSWLIVQALDRASPEQRASLDANYGRKDEKCVQIVKDIYKDLDLQRVFHDYEESSHQRLLDLIAASDPKLVPHNVILGFMKKIYKRSK